MDCLGFAIVSGLYGTKVATSGMSDKKKSKFGNEALALVGTAIECWKKVEKGIGIPVSKNAIGAAFPEFAFVIGGLDESAILPALLQLALTSDTKNATPLRVSPPTDYNLPKPTTRFLEVFASLFQWNIDDFASDVEAAYKCWNMWAPLTITWLLNHLLAVGFQTLKERSYLFGPPKTYSQNITKPEEVWLED